ncbi:hypothetical protein EBS02_00800 [bacterium]|nr:hypothetical protein [bacterium]
MHVTLNELKRAIALMESLNEQDGHLRHHGEWPLDDGLVLVLSVEHSGVRGDLHVKLFDESDEADDDITGA